MADQLLPIAPCHDILTQNYVKAESQQPRLSDQIVTDFIIPVIDLSSPDKSLIISQIANACENYGFFQVVNHKITEEMQRKVMAIGMAEEKVQLYSDDPVKKMRLSMSFDGKKENLRLHCYPLKDVVSDCPSKPELFKAHDDEGIVQVHMDIDDQPNIPSPHQNSTGEGAPEKKLTMFAATMSIFELTANRLALLKSFCAIMVLKSLWSTVHFINMLMFIFEGIRIFCPNREFELHHIHNMQLLPLSFRFISCLFYWVHLISVLTCGVLSTIGLASQDFGNTEVTLVLLYVVAMLEALVFLAAKFIWKWKVSYCRLLEKVKVECGLDTTDMDSIKRFFYDVHSKCVPGSNFEVHQMNLVTFAEQRLVSNSDEEQLKGASILKALSTHPHQHLSDDALRKIGTSTVVIPRLIQILTWNNFYEKNIKSLAAEIVLKLADKELNVLRVAGMDEAIKEANDLLGYQ